MASPISSFLRPTHLEDLRRKSAEDVQAKSAPSKEAAGAKPAAMTDDVVELSAAAQKVTDETGFDQARVDAIKKAIAESFVALEKMI